MGNEGKKPDGSIDKKFSNPDGTLKTKIDNCLSRVKLSRDETLIEKPPNLIENWKRK